MEIAILDFIHNNMASEVMDKIMVFITFLGNAGWIWIAVAAILIICKSTRDTGIKAAAALILSLVICNLILKPLVCRIRPYEINAAAELIIKRPLDYSFPSGHTSASFATAVTLMISGRKSIGIPAVILAALIAFSRLYLYVHFPSDVLAGAILGILFAFAAVRIVEFAYKKIKLRH